MVHILILLSKEDLLIYMYKYTSFTLNTNHFFKTTVYIFLMDRNFESGKNNHSTEIILLLTF